jgi:hypothetical protein
VVLLTEEQTVKRSINGWFLGLSVLGLALMGCGTNAPSNPPSSVTAFKADQGDTRLTGGQIDLESVEETETGVQFRVSDVSAYEVDMALSDDGSYRYGDLRPVAEP